MTRAEDFGRWRVTGAVRETGESIVVFLDAHSSTNAERSANRLGVIVTNIEREGARKRCGLCGSPMTQVSVHRFATPIVWLARIILLGLILLAAYSMWVILFLWELDKFTFPGFMIILAILTTPMLLASLMLLQKRVLKCRGCEAIDVLDSDGTHEGGAQ